MESFGELMARLCSSSSTIYGSDISKRPLPNEVPIGTAFVIIATPLIVYMSNGIEWVKV